MGRIAPPLQRGGETYHGESSGRDTRRTEAPGDRRRRPLDGADSGLPRVPPRSERRWICRSDESALAPESSLVPGHLAGTPAQSPASHHLVGCDQQYLRQGNVTAADLAER